LEDVHRFRPGADRDQVAAWRLLELDFLFDENFVAVRGRESAKLFFEKQEDARVQISDRRQHSDLAG
jgi:hypothetical protein